MKTLTASGRWSPLDSEERCNIQRTCLDLPTLNAVACVQTKTQLIFCKELEQRQHAGNSPLFTLLSVVQGRQEATATNATARSCSGCTKGIPPLDRHTLSISRQNQKRTGNTIFSALTPLFILVGRPQAHISVRFLLHGGYGNINSVQ